MLYNIRNQGYANVLIIIINTAVFLAVTLEEILKGYSVIFNSGLMYPPAVTEAGDYYRFFTSMFLHFDITHLANNMIMLAAVGRYLEHNLGAIKYLILYVLSGVCGNLLSFALDIHSGEFVISAGASGAVFGTVGGLLAVALKNGGKIYGLTLRRIMLMVALSLFAGLTSSGIDNAAHFGGCISGILIGLVLAVKDNTKEETNGC